MKWNTIINIQHILDDLKLFIGFPKSIISLIGGEPTLHPHFDKILLAIKDYEHELHVYTNGTTSFFNKNLFSIMQNFTWTFSYHADETDDVLFKKNILKLLKNDIKVELTVPAQNMNRALFDFILENKVDTVITFIHQTKTLSNQYLIPEWVLNIDESHIKNMSKFALKDVSYFGYTCDYKEIDIVNHHMSSNSCNNNIDLKLNAENLKTIKNRKITVCDKKYCFKDCAFLLPIKTKENI